LTAWEKIKEFYQSGDRWEIVRQWLSTFSFSMLDKTNPILKTQQALLNIADANGVRDANGRPISLQPGENAHRIARLMARSDRIGHSWLLNGVPDYNGLQARGPSLNDAIAEALGGRKRGQWNDAALKRFGLYLEARRAIVEWSLWNTKQQTLDGLAADIKNMKESRPDLADRRQKAVAAYERAQDAAVRNGARLSDARRELGSAQTELRNVQKRRQELQDDLTEAQGAIDDGSDVAKRVRDRKQRSISAVDGRQADAVRAVDEAQRKFDELSTEQAVIASTIEQLRAAADAETAGLRDHDAALDEAMANRKRTMDRGAARPPTRKSFDEYFQIIQDLEKANPTYRRAAQMVYDYQHRLLTLEWQAGKWTDDQYRALSARKDYYVPFMRDMSDVLPTIGKPPGTDIAKRFAEAKAFKGSNRNVVNVLESIARRTYNTAASVQFNDMVKALTGLSDRVGLGGAGFVERVAREETLANNQRTFQLLKDIAVRNGMDEADAHMLITSMEAQFQDVQVELLWDPDNLGPMRPPIVPLWENGERKLVRLNDPVMGRQLFEAMNATGREMSNIWVTALSKPAAALRAGVTMHPAFVASNILGDMTAAWVLTGSVARPSTYPIITQLRGAWHLAMSNERVRSGMQAMGFSPSNFADLYTRVGGISGGQNVAAMRAVRNDFDMRELRTKGFTFANLPAFFGAATTVGAAIAGGAVGGVVGATVGASVGAIGAHAIFGKGAHEVFARLSDMSETITRLGVASNAYKRVKALNPTMSDIDAIREAAFTATDVLDFERSGAKAGTLLKLIPFLNSNLQGVSKGYRQSLVLDGERGRVNMANVGKFLRYAMTRTGGDSMRRELSPADQQAVAAGLRTWVNMGILSAVGAALWLLHHEDPEYDDVANEQIKNTHFVFKLWGTWYRVKKPFELGTPSNITRTFLEWAIDNDPRLGKHLLEGIVETHAPPYLPQMAKLYSELKTGVDMRNDRPIVPDALKRLPPHMQFNAYSSEFAIQWAKALNAMGMKVSPLKIDYALNNSIAYWGREIGVSSNYYFGRNREAPKWTDVPIAGTMVNRVTLDPSRRSASVEEFWRQMGQGKGTFDQAYSGYDHTLKSGNTAAVQAYLAGLEEPERTYAVLNKHFKGREKDIHPLNRAKIINTIDATMMREMILDQLVDSTNRSAPEKITLSPAKQTEVRDILGRLSAIETWNALHDIGVKGWMQRQMRDPQPVLDELKAASPQVYEEMIRRRQRQHVGDYSEDLAKWGELKERVQELINDEDMLGLAWQKSVRKRRTPVLPLDAPTRSPNFRGLPMPQ
jgi:hypothetical protein